MGIEFLFRVMKRIGNSGDGCTALGVSSMLLSLKMVKMAHFIYIYFTII